MEILEWQQRKMKELKRLSLKNARSSSLNPSPSPQKYQVTEERRKSNV